ncbi:uncharacterized protein BO97DRAFT_52548 [Aspergillus homomorphus CBS 101889]|uniref:Uncharacterized protein n=1 Tax=Aspergillus homomorphus (strain CBS 101889) TaxID=1450537 RepID=A0A395HYT2_ASPHC|nr:hypothetical protein BO97DRAFT_52548 [Aspergillus homomorphus CBS 101889]RAL12696.1 hypothetical protein BO97DRAFT_52548 [Aspergillus homomorphus CBS 101889]
MNEQKSNLFISFPIRSQSMLPPHFNVINHTPFTINNNNNKHNASNLTYTPLRSLVVSSPSAYLSPPPPTPQKEPERKQAQAQ